MEKLIYGHFKHIFCIKKNVFKNIFHNIVENHFYIKFGIKNANLFEIKTKIFLRLFKVPVSSTEHNIWMKYNFSPPKKSKYFLCSKQCNDMIKYYVHKTGSQEDITVCNADVNSS